MNERLDADLEQRTLSANRVVQATPQAIWEAWRDPARLALWWGPHGFTNTFDVFEFREGGRWRLTMHGPDGKSYPSEFVFVRLEPHGRIVLDHVSPPVFTLTVELEDLGGKTRLDWTQVFESAKLRDAMRPLADPGNRQNLERLAAHMGEWKA